MIMSSKNLRSVFYLLVATIHFASADFGDIQSPVDFSLAHMVESDVTFYVYQNGQDVQTFSVEDHTEFTTNVRIIIHGYDEDSSVDWAIQMKDAFFAKGTYTVVIVDWSTVTRNYEVGASNVKKLGEFVGRFIMNNLVTVNGVEIIGTCLGAHAAGHAGKYIFQETRLLLPRIFGLDASAKKFEDPAVPEQHRLSHSDAQLVVVIHTDARQWGFKQPIGLIDFYPNGGNVQPGCDSGDVDEDTCSHLRANYFYAESINTAVVGQEVSISIENELVVATPVEAGIIHFGEQVEDQNGRSFVITTQSTSPYLIESA